MFPVGAGLFVLQLSDYLPKPAKEAGKLWKARKRDPVWQEIFMRLLGFTDGRDNIGDPLDSPGEKQIKKPGGSQASAHTPPRAESKRMPPEYTPPGKSKCPRTINHCKPAEFGKPACVLDRPAAPSAKPAAKRPTQAEKDKADHDLEVLSEASGEPIPAKKIKRCNKGRVRRVEKPKTEKFRQESCVKNYFVSLQINWPLFLKIHSRPGIG